MFKIILVLIGVKLCACVPAFAAAFAEVGFNWLRLLFLASQPYLSLCRREQKLLIELRKKEKVQTVRYAEGTTDTIRYIER